MEQVGTCVGQSSCSTRHIAARDMDTNFSAAVVHFIEYVNGACSMVGGEPSACTASTSDTKNTAIALKSDDAPFQWQLPAANYSAGVRLPASQFVVRGAAAIEWPVAPR
jgi:hypothetical protein